MHDPLVVAFEVRRPWPQRVNEQRRRYYWPALITVWHREPRGQDSGSKCKHFDYERSRRRWQWYLHVHHWKLQMHALQRLRRRLLTRCAWCGGRHVKGNPVNLSHQWDGPRGRWWQGEPNLFHHGCSSIAEAHRLCLCADPGLSNGDYGQCAFCGKYRSWRKVPDAADLLLAAVPAGTPMDNALRAQVEPLWDARRGAP
jgi:hypothetical protein